MATTSVFQDDVINYIEDDVEKIRTKTGMYIPYKGPDGALHLVHEIVDNAKDEINSPLSPGDTIDVIYDENQNLIEVIDNGRGMPFDYVEMVSTKIQSGSKFDRDNGDDSAGENGVGLTAVNALSHILKYTIYRQISDEKSQKGVFEFHEGKLVDKKITEVKGAKHGTRVMIIPSTEILGECVIDPDALMTWLEKLSVIMGKKETMKVTVFRKGSETPVVKKYKRKNGVVDYMDVLSEEQLVKPICIKGEKDDIKVQVAFTYNPRRNEETVDSFVNRINTIDGGCHVDAARFAIAGVLSKLGNEALTDNEKKKFKITNDDCKVGLVMIVVMSCRYPGFAGQQKEKCGNKELFKPVRAIVYSQVLRFFKDNPKELQRIITYLKRVARSRLEVNKIRKSDIDAFDSFEASTIASYSNATQDGPENEIYLNEGLSAKGSILKSRDPRFQAVLAMRGVPPNVLYMSPAEVMQSAEFGTLIRASGMGIGKDLDIRKSKFKRYIITTDADIDGINITSGLSCFFVVHWRPVVEAGMLYKALTPLYKIEDENKVTKYLVSKAQLFEEKVKNYVKLIQIRDKDGHVLTKSEMEKFFINNKNYLDILKELYTYEYVHPDIIEFVIRFAREKGFEKRLYSTFPEIKLTKDTNWMLSGSYKNVYQFLSIDEMFFQKAEPLNQLINEVDRGEMYFDYKDKDSDTWQKQCSIGNIMKNLTKYDPKIKERWKGLGAVPPSIFWDVVMNPAKRTLIRLTTKDIEDDLRKMRILHGSDPELRRMLLQAYKLDKDDIDN